MRAIGTAPDMTATRFDPPAPIPKLLDGIGHLLLRMPVRHLGILYHMLAVVNRIGS
jgi:hypothetical protein